MYNDSLNVPPSTSRLAQPYYKDNGWGKRELKPWEEVKLIEKLIKSDFQLLRLTFGVGATHLRARRVGNSVVFDAFRIEEGVARYPVDEAAKGGYWFAKALEYFYHSMPIPGPLPRSMLTVIKHHEH